MKGVREGVTCQGFVDEMRCLGCSRCRRLRSLQVTGSVPFAARQPERVQRLLSATRP